jgi:predicted kinase
MPFRLVFLGQLGSGKSHVAREAARLTGGGELTGQLSLNQVIKITLHLSK